MTSMRTSRNRGFTLIELMVVITIIGLLSSTVITSMRNVRMKAKDARRVSDLRSIRLALELYHSTNNSYPSTSGAWRSQCSTWGGYAANNVIPGLAPQYIAAVPADPDMVVTGTTCCYLYISNGTDYKFLAHNCPAIEYSRFPTLYDPRRDGGTSNCGVDGSAPWALGIYTNGMCGT